MWAYVIAFTEDLQKFMMVRSRKRGGWEMPGGRSIDGEHPLDTAIREFKEETGHHLNTMMDWRKPLEDGFVFFGFIGEGDPSRRSLQEISDVSLFHELPEDLAYPSVEYLPLIEFSRSFLS
jgi:8-oxo-dGTP diphosphatase